MTGKRTITIESPPENTLSVQVEAALVDRFVSTATKKDDPFRSKRESFQKALESAVASALMKFLDSVKRDESLKTTNPRPENDVTRV